ncbi:hypothetical protein WN51_07473, partial [Melipona quadrifasciata]
ARWRPINAAGSKSRIHQGDPEDNANSGYFAPRTGGWTSVRVSGERKRDREVANQVSGLECCKKLARLTKASCAVAGRTLAEARVGGFSKDKEDEVILVMEPTIGAAQKSDNLTPPRQQLCRKHMRAAKEQRAEGRTSEPVSSLKRLIKEALSAESETGDTHQEINGDLLIEKQTRLPARERDMERDMERKYKLEVVNLKSSNIRVCYSSDSSEEEFFGRTKVENKGDDERREIYLEMTTLSHWRLLLQFFDGQTMIKRRSNDAFFVIISSTISLIKMELYLQRGMHLHEILPKGCSSETWHTLYATVDQEITIRNTWASCAPAERPIIDQISYNSISIASQLSEKTWPSILVITPVITPASVHSIGRYNYNTTSTDNNHLRSTKIDRNIILVLAHKLQISPTVCKQMSGSTQSCSSENTVSTERSKSTTTINRIIKDSATYTLCLGRRLGTRICKDDTFVRVIFAEEINLFATDNCCLTDN